MDDVSRPDPKAAAALERRSRWFSRARLAVGAAVAAILVARLGYGRLPSTLAWSLTGLGLVALVLLISAHERLERRRQRLRIALQLDEERRARLARDWPTFAHDPAPTAPARIADDGSPPRSAPADDEDDARAAAADLDLHGQASLRQLLGRTASPSGEGRLMDWMREALRRAPPDLQARQQAVAELAADASHRRQLLVEGLASGTLRASTAAAFMHWLTAPPTRLAAPWAGGLAALLPLGALALLVADRAGLRVGGGWLLLVALSWGARALAGRAIAPAFAGADALSGEVRRYRDLLRLWEQRASHAPWLRERQARLTAHGPASAALGRLARLVDLSDLRWSHLPHALIHSVTGWDLHVACALERWRARHGMAVGAWFDALADLDAAATLAAVGEDEPGWTWPRVAVDADIFEARDLAHPLLPPPGDAASPNGVPGRDAPVPLAAAPGTRRSRPRVANDVTIGPAGRVLVVTGSNMSGKSTLLRAVGLNVVLAQMGAPVCASALSMPPLRLETSVRLTDSLAAGVSYFMAALLRIKSVVTAADAPRLAGEPRVLYLLDEVLQGTNSDERLVAIRHIVAHLVRTPALGALTTHDLRLVDTPEFGAHADHVHFTEHIDALPDGSPRITFDYRLRPGPARSRNALALVRLVGLGDASAALGEMPAAATPSRDR